MKFDEFKIIAMTLKTVYPSMKSFDTENGIDVWFQMVKDLDYKIAAEASAIHIKQSPYPPTIADLRGISQKLTVPDWSVEWQKLLKRAKYEELNAPAQYALSTLTDDYVRLVPENYEKAALCMREFEKLYTNYFKLSQTDKQMLKEMGIWSEAPERRLGIIRMNVDRLVRLQEEEVPIDYSNAERVWD